MVICLIDLIPAADTEAHGGVLFARLRDALRSGDRFVVSFAGISTATSSFVNAAFVELLHDFSFADIKARLRIVDSTAQINDMVRSRLQREAEKLAVAA